MPVAFDSKAFLAMNTIFTGGIKRLLSTAADDLAKDGMASQLAQMTLAAIASGNAARIELLKAGVPWLLTFYEFKATNEANTAFAQFVSVVTDTASALLGSLGGGLGGLLKTEPRKDPLQ